MNACDITNDGAIGCSDDCLGRNFCLSGTPHTLDCYKQTRNSFCNPETLECVVTKVPCKKLNYKFTCPGEGYYPDPYNCSKFFICSGSNQIAVHGSCFDKEAFYNPKLQVCEANISCHNFTSNGLCYLKDRTIQVHPLDKRFYFLCSEDSHVLKKCAETHIFNPFTLRCEISCNQPGKLVDPENNKCFYDCVSTGAVNGFDKLYKCCQRHEIFSEQLGACVPTPNHATEL